MFASNLETRLSWVLEKLGLPMAEGLPTVGATVWRNMSKDSAVSESQSATWDTCWLAFQRYHWRSSLSNFLSRKGTGTGADDVFPPSVAGSTHNESISSLVKEITSTILSISMA